MSKTQKSLMIGSWALGVLAMISLVASGMLRPKENDRPQPQATGPKLYTFGKLPEFSLIDQNGQPFTDKTMSGHVWVCDFVFTRCQGPCPAMSQHMAELQKTLADTDVHLASFSVDPKYDTPKVLKEYAQLYHADENRWTLLTGDQKTIYAVARAMMIGASPSSDGTTIDHNTNFMLVDRDGTIVGPFHGSEAAAIEQLAAEARRRAGSK